MSKAVISPPESTPAGEVLRPSASEVRAQLGAILASPAFHGSKRCQKFLEHVCERVLAGQENTLKERTIAIEVFGRQPESDLAEDTIVRVGAREVRKRLAQFYVSSEGMAAEIRIDLLPGTYVPEFRHAAIHKEVEPAPSPIPASPTVTITPWWRTRNIQVAAVLVVAAVVAAGWFRWTAVSPNVAAFRLFWQPVLRSSDPLLVAVAHPIVYHPSRHAMRLNNEALGPTNEGQRPLQLPPKVLDGSDMIPVLNQYVGFGDMVLAAEVTSLLAHNNRSTRIRFASAIEFADMRSGTTLLIGATTNRWTMEFESKWRFRFVRNHDTRVVLLDSAQPGREWSIPAKDDGSSPDDYFLICRIRHSITGGLIMVGAGLKQFGTEAAGRLMTDPDQLGVILRKLPAGWDSKNLQVVLHTQVIGNTPAQPDVVAWHVW